MNRTIFYYDEHAEEYCAVTANADMSYCRDRFMAYLPVGAHILDAGCGSGRDSRVFLEKGFIVTAVDASEKICKEAEKLLGQDVLQCTFQKMSFLNEFDGIWACASLLHVKKDEINLVMKNLRTALKPDGILYASFKYGTKERMVQGRLFNDYDEKSLITLLINNGFMACDVFITEDVRTTRHGEKWVNAIARML
ncbi:MAG: class I SAM-dependent methyltransferase [Lachnospiraceae bacterium]|nr:class I SAM-dependent methyltransferase [Lachnospiraceae bacterium]